MSAIGDRWKFAYWCTFFIGFTILLPWNILITVSGFWDFKFRNVSSSELGANDSSGAMAKTELQTVFGSYVAIASNIPNATFVILHAICGHRFSLRFRVFGSQVGMIATLAAITLLASFNSDEWQELFLQLVLAAIILINSFSAILQGSFGSLISIFPHEYMGHWVNGAGMGGLLPSLINVLILVANPDQEASGFACFLFALIATVICLGLSALMVSSNYYRHLLEQMTHETKEDQEEQTNESICERIRAEISATVGIYKSLGRPAWIYMLITFTNFSVTLAVFPGVAALAQSSTSDREGSWSKIFFVPICCFVVFNLADYIGKQSAVWVQKPGPSNAGQRLLLALAIMRVALIPLIAFCNVSVSQRNTQVAFPSDIAYTALTAVLGASNGYIGNIALMFGPKVSQDKSHQETVAAALVATLVIGCGTGSVISNILVKHL